LLAAHLAPGYFATVASQSHWQEDWSGKKRSVLWMAALTATFAPDLDVIYNVLFRGHFGHITLWTHSIFTIMGIVACWLALRSSGKWPYLQTLVGLVAAGGLSHLALDVVSHGTPLFNPFSLDLIGFPSNRVLRGGLWGYLTDPIFLLEPVLLTSAAAQWVIRRDHDPRVRRLALQGLFAAFAAFSGIFLLLLPTFHGLVVI
jgi:hypothetical protein